MRPVEITPTTVDREIASTVAQNTNPSFEQAAQAVTWGADEHILVAAAVVFWLISRRGNERARTAGTHFLATSIATGIIPHALKDIFNQRRPDRLTAIGHLHGIPISGRPNDAFPSGHAVHMGALAGAASAFPRPYRKLTWSAAIGLSLTRIAVLAHWSSDVAAGFVGGFLIERLVRRWTGYGRSGRSND
jgi:membrane-associated phospholipid phosphatase